MNFITGALWGGGAVWPITKLGVVAIAVAAMLHARTTKHKSRAEVLFLI
jgi:hypothetical protein